jgi:hypothetical protein
MNQGVETGKSFLELKRDGRVRKPSPEVGRVSIRFAKDSWSYKKAISSVAPVRLALSLPGGRREIWIKPHRRFWLYWWKVLSKETELASTLILKRRRNKWYAIFVFDLAPKKETPAEVVAFDVNENWVAVARLSLLSTVDAVARRNRQYLDPAVYSIKTDFGRLAKRYEAVRGRKLEELKRKYPYAGSDDEEKVQNVADTGEFRRFAKRLRERRRKEGQVRQIAREMVRLSDVIRLEEPDVLSQRYGKTFEKAVLVLLKAKDAAAALRTFIEHYGEPHTGAFAKLMKLAPWAREVVEVEPAPPVALQVDGVAVTAQADFLVKYADGRRELVELKSHILKRGEWETKAVWSLAVKMMRMLYRRAGFDYPIRLIYFAERGGDAGGGGLHINDEKDDAPRRPPGEDETITLFSPFIGLPRAHQRSPPQGLTPATAKSHRNIDEKVKKERISLRSAFSLLLN